MSVSLKLITWNINMNASCKQFDAMLSIVLDMKPDVVFFQEVTHVTLGELIKKLGKKGYDVATRSKMKLPDYFIATATRTKVVRVIRNRVVDFSKSRMNRWFLTTEAEFKGRRINLINSHLESLKESAEERKNQLSRVFKAMKFLDEDVPVVFAGDMNIRDSEIVSMGGLPKEIKDVWEVLGKPKNCSFTWSTRWFRDDWQIPHHNLRFDRVFFLSRKEGDIKPREMAPLGNRQLPSRVYPSDHIGLFVVFSLK